MRNKIHLRIIDWTILILVVLLVPFIHGILPYCGIVTLGLLLVALNHIIAKKRVDRLGPK